MTTEQTSNGLIGASLKRVEDPPLITGKGCYVDDINLPSMLYLAFQRSPYPHAKILSIDISKAKTMPGVVTVITGNDISEKLNLTSSQMLPNMKIPPHPVLARGAVHCAGVPVAAVVAATRAQAEDAAEAVEVEYEALPSVSNAEEALKPGAPLAREEIDSNVCYTMTKNGGNVDKAFAETEVFYGVVLGALDRGSHDEFERNGGSDEESVFFLQALGSNPKKRALLVDRVTDGQGRREADHAIRIKF